MSFSELHKSAINNALKCGLSFALFRDKNSETLTFVCDDNKNENKKSDVSFFAVNWLDKYATRTIINDCLTLNEAANYQTDCLYTLQEPFESSTDKTDYTNYVKSLAEELFKNGGKTVISRTISLDMRNTIAEVAEKYFSANNNVYCCLIHSPQIGCWLIASPELLLAANHETKEIQTVALAGTRKINSLEAWDKKNIREQHIVRDFIIEALSELNIKHKAAETATMQTNNIEHLATFITGKIKGDDDIERVIDTLNPTPALCGIPRATAVEAINRIENHPRRLYGGYFGYNTGTEFKAIVTLRCAQLSATKACIYAGGGITADSDPLLEWDETSLKSQVISDIITTNNHE